MTTADDYVTGRSRMRAAAVAEVQNHLRQAEAHIRRAYHATTAAAAWGQGGLNLADPRLLAAYAAVNEAAQAVGAAGYAGRAAGFGGGFGEMAEANRKMDDAVVNALDAVDAIRAEDDTAPPWHLAPPFTSK